MLMGKQKAVKLRTVDTNNTKDVYYWQPTLLPTIQCGS